MFGMDNLGEPMKWAIQVPRELTRRPAMAKAKPQATMPRLAAPEPTPAKEMAIPMPTEEIGDTIIKAKIMARQMQSVVCSKVKRWAINSPILPVMRIKYG